MMRLCRGGGFGSLWGGTDARDVPRGAVGGGNTKCEKRTPDFHASF